MAASANDYFQKVGRSTATTLSAPGYTVADTAITVASTTNWPTTTGITFAIDEVDASGNRVTGTYNVFRGTVSSATQINNLTYVGGDANRNYSAGATTRVYILVSSYRDNRLVDGLLVAHNQDGTLKTDSVDSPQIKPAAVTAGKIDWNSTGAGGGIWWEELGRTTLTTAGDTISISSLSAKKYLRIYANFWSVGGTTDAIIRFNNDSSSNYAYYYAPFGGTATTETNRTGIIITGAATLINQFAFVEVINLANREKGVVYSRIETNTGGAGTAPSSLSCVGKWANTSTQINRIDIVNTTGSGDYAIGSELVVLGHN